MIKNNLYILFLGLIFLVSCGNGLSEKEKNEIENFEEEWNVNIQMGNLLSEKLDMAEKLIFAPIETTIQDSITTATTNLEKSEKEYRSIEKKYNLFILNLNKEYSNWVNFKSKAMKDEIEYTEMTSFLNSKRKILLEFQTDISKLIIQTDKLLSEIQSK
jgi:hypothetical protein